MAHAALQCESCPVRDSAACSALAPDERMQLAHIGHHRTVMRGQTLFSAGDDSAWCATLISGALKISSIDSEGTERILSLIHPAGFVGELFAPMAHHDIVALADSRLCIFSRSQYEAAVERFPALARALLCRSGEDLLESRTLIDLMSRRTSLERVAGLILTLARAASHSPCHIAEAFDLPLSRSEMAGLLGITIETVSRRLTELDRRGIIRKKGARGLEILDAPRLEGLVG